MRRFLLVLIFVATLALPSAAQVPSTYTPQLITFQGVPTGVCSVYQIAENVTNGNYYTCNISNKTWFPVGGGNSVISASAYGVKANGKQCIGTDASVSANIVTCATASFTGTDIGKTIFATTGHGAGTNNYLGTLVLAQSTITKINSSTSVTVSNSVTGTCSSTATCEVDWGNLDDAALTAAEADWANTVPCGNLVLPTGLILVSKGHFNPSASACPTSVPDQSYGPEVSGQGPGQTIVVIVPSFDFTTCAASAFSSNSVCFFNYKSSVVMNIGFTGSGYGNTGTHNNISLIGLGWGAQSFQLTASGFGGSDAGTNFYGIELSQGARAIFTISDGFGSIPLASTQSNLTSAWNYCYWCFAADSLKENLHVSAGSKFYDYGSEYGPSGSAKVITVDGQYTSVGASHFKLGGVNEQANSVYTTVTSGGQAYFNDSTLADMSNCNATCTGLSVLSGGTAYISNSLFSGSGQDILNNGTVFELGGNTYNTTGAGTGVWNHGLNSQFDSIAEDGVRANAVTLGANWTQSLGNNAIQIVSHQFESTVANTASREVYTASAFPNDQYSSVRLIAAASTSVTGPMVRGVGSAAVTEYECITVNALGVSQTMALREVISGTVTNLQTFTATPAVGDVWTISASGSTITCSQNGVVKATATNSDITGGSPGMVIFESSNIANAILADWQGGWAPDSPASLQREQFWSSTQNIAGTRLIAGVPTVSSGFGTNATVSAGYSSSAFRINVGTSNTGTGVIALPTAPTGWNCYATDLTTKSTTVSVTLQTASSTTSATLQNYTDIFGTHAWVDNDILAVSCFAY